MKPLTMTMMIPAPLALRSSDPAPVVLARTTVRSLCALAGIACRVTGGEEREVVLHQGDRHLRAPGSYYVGVGTWAAEREPALRALEVLAHSFHDYAARECVCGRGLFVAPQRTGRPPLGGRAMTAAERMRKMRRRRAQPAPT